MIPDLHAEAAKKISEALSKALPEKEPLFQKNLEIYLKEISVAVADRKRYRDIPVIVSRMQAPFLEWLGMRVVACYGAPEEITSQGMARLIEEGKTGKAVLVIDNLQNGPDAGAPLARELGIAHVTLSNFPLRGSYLETLQENLKKLNEALP
jgi:zinc transport system substrate-binding protein